MGINVRDNKSQLESKVHGTTIPTNKVEKKKIPAEFKFLTGYSFIKLYNDTTVSTHYFTPGFRLFEHINKYVEGLKPLHTLYIEEPEANMYSLMAFEEFFQNNLLPAEVYQKLNQTPQYAQVILNVQHAFNKVYSVYHRLSLLLYYMNLMTTRRLYNAEQFDGVCDELMRLMHKPSIFMASNVKETFVELMLKTTTTTTVVNEETKPMYNQAEIKILADYVNKILSPVILEIRTLNKGLRSLITIYANNVINVGVFNKSIEVIETSIGELNQLELRPLWTDQDYYRVLIMMMMFSFFPHRKNMQPKYKFPRLPSSDKQIKGYLQEHVYILLGLYDQKPSQDLSWLPGSNITSLIKISKEKFFTEPLSKNQESLLIGYLNQVTPKLLMAFYSAFAPAPERKPKEKTQVEKK